MNSLQALGNLASNFCKKSKTLFFTVIVAYIACHIEKRIFQIVCVISEKIMKIFYKRTAPRLKSWLFTISVKSKLLFRYYPEIKCPNVDSPVA